MNAQSRYRCGSTHLILGYDVDAQSPETAITGRDEMKAEAADTSHGSWRPFTDAGVGPGKPTGLSYEPLIDWLANDGEHRRPGNHTGEYRDIARHT